MIFLINFVVVFLFNSEARAFHIPEHAKITIRALDGLKNCGLLSNSWDQGWTAAVVRADQNEDYDLFRKWSKYSHYYNPLHPIRQMRADSSLSVIESVREIQKDFRNIILVNPSHTIISANQGKG